MKMMLFLLVRPTGRLAAAGCCAIGGWLFVLPVLLFAFIGTTSHRAVVDARKTGGLQLHPLLLAPATTVPAKTTTTATNRWRKLKGRGGAYKYNNHYCSLPTRPARSSSVAIASDCCYEQRSTTSDLLPPSSAAIAAAAAAVAIRGGSSKRPDRDSSYYTYDDRGGDDQGYNYGQQRRQGEGDSYYNNNDYYEQQQQYQQQQQYEQQQQQPYYDDSYKQHDGGGAAGDRGGYYNDDDYYDDRGQPNPRQQQGQQGRRQGGSSLQSNAIMNNLPSVLKYGDRRIGLPLLGSGALLVMLGMTLMFNKTLMRLGNLMFIAGVPLTIGPKRTAGYFLQPQKMRATACVACGILLVLWGHPFWGILLQVFGLLNLFGNMFPVLWAIVKNMPVVSSILNNNNSNNNNRSNSNGTRNRNRRSSRQDDYDDYNRDRRGDYYDDQDYY